jgi:hypothetical protein
MFEKLLALLLHAKGSVVAGLFVVGTTGILVSGTINGENVNLTIQPLTSPTATASATATATATPLLSHGTPTPVAASATATPVNGDCEKNSHARNDALKALQAAWEKSRQDLALLQMVAREKGKGDQAEKALSAAKKAIDSIRRDAAKKIQAAAHLDKSCAKSDDDTDVEVDELDGDKNDDHANAAQKGALDAAKEVDIEKDDHDSDKAHAKASPKASPKATAKATAKPSAKPATTNGTITLDPKFKAIVDKAIEDMNKAVMDGAKKLADVITNGPKQKSTSVKGHHSDREGDN